MKKLVLTALAALAFTPLLRAESIPIDEAHFPDAAFRQFVLTEMKYHKSNGTWALVGEDGMLSDYERKRVVTIGIPDGCKSAEGIKYFAKSETGTWGMKVWVESDDLKTLDLSGMDVTSVKADGHKLETLNLAGCTKLTEVECQMNRLTTLNVEGCTKLSELKCYENQITALNLAQMQELRYLDCHDNQLTGLNINSPALQKIDCSHNPLQWLFLPNIDYSINGYWTDLDCSDTQLSSLDLRDNRYNSVDCSNSPILGIEWSSAGNGYVVNLNCNNTKILPEDILAIPNPDKVKDLSCAGCGLTTLDLSKLTNLNWVDCGDNLLTTLDVSHNTVLRGCFVNNNQLFALDVSGTSCQSLSNSWQHIEGQTVEMNGKTYVRLNSEVDVNKISGLSVRHESTFRATAISNPTMQGEYLLVDETGSADVSKVEYKYDAGNGLTMNVQITTGDYGVAINEYNFPDQGFRNYLLGQDYGQDALLTQDEIAAITVLYPQSQNISTLEGIQYLTNLTTLDVSSNNLTDAGFSDLMAYLPNLTELQFNDNRSITRFDAGMNTKLRKLSCYGCALTSLDVRGCTELQELVCDDNQLTFLNLSENTKLRRLQTGGNRLTEIYGLSALTELRNLVCENNQIATLDVSTFPMLAELQCGGNSLTTLDLRQNGNLRYLYVEKNQLSTLLLPESAPLKWLRIFGNQLKNDAMRDIVEKLPTLATTYKVRAYYEGLSTEGNELSPAVVSAMRAKNWNPQYTTTGTSWQDYAGGIVTYALKLCGTSVTSANAANLSAISGVTGTASFDELTNTLTLSGVTVNHSNSVGLESSIDGLTIVLEGDNTFNITGFNGLYLRKKTTITGTGTLSAMSNKNGIYILADTLFVKGGATVSGGSTGTTGYGILGRKTARQGIDGEVYTYYGSLAVSGDETKVQALGATASIGQLKSLTMTTGTTIKVTDNSGVNPRQVNGYFYDHSVCTRSGNATTGYTYTPATGQVVITAPKAGLPINATNFPDEAFRNYLLAQSYGTDAILTDDELEGISSLQIINLGIADLTGITHFFALERLYASGNQLTTVYLEDLTMLETVDVMDNRLDLSGLITLVNSLPEGDGTNLAMVYHEGSANEQNVEPTDQLVTAAWQKGWKLGYQKADGSYGWYERQGVPIDQDHFPDEAFRLNVAVAYDLDRDGFLTTTEAQAVTHMFMNGQGIEDLTGIEYFTELTWLYCHENNLTKLQLSENTKLEVLDCHDNQLTQLTIKNCGYLNILRCYNNRLNQSAMKNLIVNLPTCAESGEMSFYYEGSANEGNSISMAHLNNLWDNKNWSCYFTKNGTDWLPLLAGDVNRDGQVTSADVAPLADVLLGKSAAPAIRVDDVNADYKFTVADLTKLVEMLVSGK
ncbi:MAG: hypothetical protein IJ176_03310 [Prevotella sp.]|nr:hypothetical protein [Prevotella sp.]MBQ9646538.1 hypothetical protein [Prevotella sp.]